MEGDGMFHSLPNNSKAYHSGSPGNRSDWAEGHYAGFDTSKHPSHSTPKSKTKASPSIGSPNTMSSFSAPSMFSGSHSHANNTSFYGYKKTSPAAKGVHSSPAVVSSTSNSPGKYQSGSPLTSTPNKSFMSELETSTIQKQRRELQLLIGELQDRDRELNEMVASHQKQLLAWEHDRQKLLTLEQRHTRLQGELGSRTDQLRTLTTRIKVLESQDQSKSCAIESAQKQLQDMAEKASSTSMHVRELEEKNSHLSTVTRDLSSKIGNLEGREQELLTMLKLKDTDLAEASSHIGDVAGKLKRIDQSNKELRQHESRAKKELSEWKHRHSEARAEADKLREEMSERHNTTTEQSIELGRAKEQVLALKREHVLAGEREKRKEQLLELQKSKQERTDCELTNLRQVYERQQRDLALIQLNLDSTQDKMRNCSTQLNNNSSLHTGNHILIDSDCDSPSPTNSESLSPPLVSEHHNGVITDLLQDGITMNDQGSEGSADTEELLTSHQCEGSPTSKLQRLLTESRQMVQNLELTALPPYVHTPSEQNESSHTSGIVDNS